MAKAVTGFALVLTISVSSVTAGSSLQKTSAHVHRLNPQIGSAKRQQYSAIRDGKDWKNPILVVRRDGVEILMGGVSSDGRIVAMIDLEGTLIELPVNAWPYGRVVAVSEIGIREADRSDEEPIANNLAATLAILKKLKVAVETWPSA